MEQFSISQVAQRTGFSTSALRFYEESGLLSPDRTSSGYRTYNAAHVDRLFFVRRAKGFGLFLEEISELLQMLEGGRCAPVQDRLRSLVSRNLDETKDKIAELAMFSDDLVGFLDALSGHTPGGACDQSCGCVHDDQQASDAVETAPSNGGVCASIVAKPVGYVSPHSEADQVLACSLAASDVETRVAEWKGLVSGAVRREPVEGGTRLIFPRSADLSALVGLVSSENDCCSFFRFVVEVDADAVVLQVTAPESERSMVAMLVGSAS